MGIIDDVKSVGKTVQQIDNIELYRQILDLQGEILELVDENRSLKARVSELEENERLRSEVMFRNDAYWLPVEGGKQDGPFCSNCWDARRNLVRMHESAAPEYLRCPSCKEAARVRR